MKATALKKSYRVIFRLTWVAVFALASKPGFTQGRVLINEYLSWPANSCAVTSEYIELFNFGPGPVNIGCYILTDGDYAITIPPNTIIQPGQYFVIAGQSTLPLGCANANMPVTVNLNWNTCNCTSGAIPTTGDGLMTDGGSGSEQLVLFDPSLKVVDAIVRDLSETASLITTSSVGAQCIAHSFDLDNMNIAYEQVGESQGRANSFARRIDGGCGWLKDPQQSGGASNNTPGAVSNLNASLAVTTAFTCTNTGGASVSVSSGDYSQIFPVKYTLAKDTDSNAIYNFADSYFFGTDSSAHTVPVTNLTPGIYTIVIETSAGCDLRSFNFNILNCQGGTLSAAFTSLERAQLSEDKIRLTWTIANKDLIKAFIIQKSDDGIHFKNYSTIQNPSDILFSSAFFFEDAQAEGDHFYRIQAIMKNGNVINSLINTPPVWNGPGRISVYPNPFRRNLTVSVEGNNTELIRISLWDGLGRKVGNQQAVVRKGHNSIPITTTSMVPGIYMIKLESSSINTTKIIKMID